MLSGASRSAQCCTTGGECRRTVGVAGQNDDRDCIARKGNKNDCARITAYTYAETVSRCATLELVLCEQSCAGKGCDYNQYPEYSSVP